MCFHLYNSMLVWMVSPWQDWATLEEYKPVKPLDVLAEEIGVPVERLVKLDANENLYGPVDEIKAALQACNALHIYPDPAQTYLLNSLSEYTGVPPSHIVAGCGSDELLDVVMRLVEPGSVVTCPPTFGMYSFLGKICGYVGTGHV
jgi:histidinol-phosphate aminotransferase